MAYRRYKRYRRRRPQKGILPTALGFISQPLAKAGIRKSSTRWWLTGLASAGVVGALVPNGLTMLQRPVNWAWDKVSEFAGNMGLDLGGGLPDDYYEGETEETSWEDFGELIDDFSGESTEG